MTRKQYRNKTMALADKIAVFGNHHHIDGKSRKHYRDLTINDITPDSYAEAWENLKPARELVGM